MRGRRCFPLKHLARSLTELQHHISLCSVMPKYTSQSGHAAKPLTMLAHDYDTAACSEM